jgi:hypothetical protein
MFIRPLSNPWTVSGTRRILSTPTYSWERVGGAVNEGAEVLQQGGKTFIVYSASHCAIRRRTFLEPSDRSPQPIRTSCGGGTARPRPPAGAVRQAVGRSRRHR